MTATQEKNSYKGTLNLPQTSFPMEAKLTTNEPVRLAAWTEGRLYEKIIIHRSKSPKWVLHDGPPFANGDIHIGHLINKTLKDVIIRFRTMQGYQSPYVPGWDCHGLPIEHKIQQELGPKIRQMDVVEVRKLCYAYADKYVKIQSEQFQRLGILGEWNNPYLTMQSEYEGQTLEVFARFVEEGLVYKQLKPVPWSIENQTALADAELEYSDVKDKSVYVLFEVAGEVPAGLQRHGDMPFYLMIWTTTPWTLPANLAVAVNPQSEYGLYTMNVGGREVSAIIAKERAQDVLGLGGGSSDASNTYVAGNELAGLTYKHPFVERVGKVVIADYVTLEDGTGLVHTAPGHGEDDYETGVREKLEVYSPVLANGRFDETAPEWLRGKSVWEANPLITEHLKKSGLLYFEKEITHSYPHDWRSKKPIIFRATEQWFISVEKPFVAKEEGDAPRSLRQRALDAALNKIEFVPKWGEARLVGMLESRPDWCVSRQRAWGLPIPVFYNENGEALLTPESVRAVAKVFGERGSDAWFTLPAGELLGRDFKYPAGFSAENLRKEKDIFDVWFESGSSWQAVLRNRSYLHFPADLYLEGSDQHRGWFQLSLLPSLGATGRAPFRQVLTHGFVVKPDGTKVSKSDKSYVTATAEVNRHGADVLRLWCCSVDYQNDIPASPDAIKEFSDKYRKIRNTLRYLLSNLYDFDPATDEQAIPAASLDGWACAELDHLIEQTTRAYDQYELHRAFRLLHDFCAVQISAVYGNAMKDRLYCELPTAGLRRRCQTVMYRMVSAITRLLAPILVFTADEAWEKIPHRSGADARVPSVHMTDLPVRSGPEPSADQQEEWKQLMVMRDTALAALDVCKKQQGLNKASDAELVYDFGVRDRYEKYGVDLEDLVGAGFHRFEDLGGQPVSARDAREKYKTCARSWKRRPDVGADAEYPDLSARDAAVVRALGQKKN
jgi:isoleucyl-tRNA synthetase